MNNMNNIVVRNYLVDLLNIENEIRNSGSVAEFDNNLEVVEYLENLINLLNDEIEVQSVI